MPPGAGGTEAAGRCSTGTSNPSPWQPPSRFTDRTHLLFRLSQTAFPICSSTPGTQQGTCYKQTHPQWDDTFVDSKILLLKAAREENKKMQFLAATLQPSFFPPSLSHFTYVKNHRQDISESKQAPEHVASPPNQWPAQAVVIHSAAGF